MSGIAQEIANLEQRINRIKKSGEVAPEHLWIEEYQAGSKRKDSSYRYYTYLRVRQSPPGQKSKIINLGKDGSEKHRYWLGAIARRDAIKAIQNQIKKLESVSVQLGEIPLTNFIDSTIPEERTLTNGAWQIPTSFLARFFQTARRSG